MSEDLRTISISRSSVTLLQAVAAPRRPCLILYSGADAGRPFDLAPGTVVVGRSPDVDFHLDEPSISRRHAELRVNDEQVVIADLGSANGTWIDEVRLEAPRALQGGEMIRMGMLVFRYYESQSLEAALHDRIYRLATVDSLTEVFNRRYLMDTLKREIAFARRHGSPLSLVCYDLDHFKRVNDGFGHGAGDAVLRDSAALLRTALQGHGVLGRLGGEEFAVVLPHTALPAAAEVAERGRAALAAHRFLLEGQHLHRQTLSAGVAQLEPGMADPGDLLTQADRRLYVSKNTGRDRVTAG